LKLSSDFATLSGPTEAARQAALAVDAGESSGMWDVLIAYWPVILGTVATLVFLEGLLSADNALVLAVMVKHLPKHQQKRALRFGIWGAFGFRLIAVLLSSVLYKIWIFKVIGGAYLLFLAISHFVSRGEGGEVKTSSRFGSGFWGTVISVELADIAFSIDSILAAVALADDLPKDLGDNWRIGIIYVGGILGIITMRFVAGYFILLLERFKGLETGAYVLVAWIGLKLIGSGLHSHNQNLPVQMPEWLFWSGMGLIVVVSMLTGRSKKKETGTEVLVEAGQSEPGPNAQTP
jgi:YkoY family integral membrane protein